MARSADDAAPSPSRARCRCGHLPTHHMVVIAVAGNANYRLEPSGPCAICGESVCKKFTPGGA
ncbi:MAG TPA: hypothetical protein VMC82_04945 [Thermoplasmata archaeon]|nr:hypothetical protein [Thermoplasmata archaeon]